MEYLENETQFAEVILPLPLPGLYTYRIPVAFQGRVSVGARVVVQFGKRKFYTAIVRKLRQLPPAEYEAKYILEVLDQEPFISQRELEFWEWMSDYYMCALGEVMGAAIPSGLKIQSETVVIPNDEFYEGELDEKEQLVMTLLEVKQKLLADDVVRALGSEHAAWKILRSMYEKGLLWFQESYEQRYKPKKVHYVQLHEAFREESKLEELFSQLEKRAPRQVDVLLRYIQLAPQYSAVEKSKLQLAQNDSALFRALSKKGVFIQFTEEESHLEKAENSEEVIVLTEAQARAKEELIELWKSRTACLLYGPGGSGKTHIYISLIQDYLAMEKQVLLLLPEIALTFEFIQRLENVFGEKVLYTHSKFGSNERTEVFARVRDGSCRVLVGARSAVFMPFKELGLIIVDEEHDPGYKQFDPAPRYHGRDVSIYLARMHDARVLLGSSTPAFETLFHASNDKYGLVRLNKRYADLSAPEVGFINMLQEQKDGTLKGIFSSQLLREISERKERAEQSILFHNQKGYVPHIQCEQCAWTPKCVNCDITLTYYKGVNLLRCHYCGFKRSPYDQCTSCGSKQLKMSGYGTEKIEDELRLLIPGIIVDRFDANTVKNRTAFDRIIGDFQEGKTHVLIGTQLITKGIDFKNVSLAAVLNTDQMFQYPDFRSSERAFQTIIQLSGRIGRNGQKGLLLLQTRNPGHFMFEWLKNLSYTELYNAQLHDRERFLYPPYARLIKLTLKGKEAALTEKAAITLSDQMKSFFGHSVLGPERPYISRIRGMFHFHILFKFSMHGTYKDYRNAKFRIFKMMQAMTNDKEFRGKVRIQADVDPV